ncbi:MAG TPA: D-alanine--D-alanine ligase [Aeromonadales bacterium]|nr:D-alanine--D-alanine ligase [Aeromonadales bacterium]
MNATKDYGRVAVLMGGFSAEREISLLSGEAIYQGLKSAGIDAHKVVVERDIIRPILARDFDFVFIALHGRGGEDGMIQGALEAADILYSGSGILASSLAMDKEKTKNIWQAIQLPTPPSVVITETDSIDNKRAETILNKLGPVVFVKPTLEGSSVGMSKVNEVDDLLDAIKLAGGFNSPVLIEQFIDGDEYTVAVLGGKALPAIRLQTPREFYDYKAKYQSDNTQYHCPAGLSQQHENELAELTEAAYQSLDCKAWARIDVMRTSTGQWQLLEVNTVPGMTQKSLVPMAAKQAGISFADLLVQIMQFSLVENKMTKGK